MCKVLRLDREQLEVLPKRDELLDLAGALSGSTPNIKDFDMDKLRDYIEYSREQ